MITSDEWTPSAIACAQAASTAGNPSVRHRGQDGDHLPIAIVGTGEPTPHAFQCGGQDPVPEWCPIAQCAGLAGQHRHVMPWVVDRLAPAIAAVMFPDDAPVLADDDPISIGVDLDGPPDRTGVHRVFVVVEADQACLRRPSASMPARRAPPRRCWIGPVRRPWTSTAGRPIGRIVIVGDTALAAPRVKPVGMHRVPRRRPKLPQRRHAIAPRRQSLCPRTVQNSPTLRNSIKSS